MVFVLSGRIEIHHEHYESITLEEDDCAYFDSTIGHALVLQRNESARVLWACTHSRVNDESGLAGNDEVDSVTTK